MTRLAIGAGLLVWVGATLLLSRWTRLSRPGLTERLRPYSPGGGGGADPAGLFSVASLRDVVGPLARVCGDRLAAVFGVTEPLSSRLRRIHSDMDVNAFRVRQLAGAGLAVLAAAVLAGGLGLPALVAILVIAGAPLLTFLVLEQRLVRASERWQQDLALELPVVSEQLAMLLNAGFSLGAALARLSERGHGCAARDLAVVREPGPSRTVRDRGVAGVGRGGARRRGRSPGWCSRPSLRIIRSGPVGVGRGSPVSS